VFRCKRRRERGGGDEIDEGRRRSDKKIKVVFLKRL
jgi:hypothetical protein